MRLSQLHSEAARRCPDLTWETRGDLDVTIAGLSLDSRHVGAGELFFCVPGEITDGHRFAGAAVEAGAGALVVQRWVDHDVPQIRVDAVRPAMAQLAAVFHGDPSGELDVVGVTGTNGKTTTAHLVRSVLDHHGRGTGLLGTLSGARTTPEAPELQRALRAFADDGMVAVAMEVSSHALAQHRVDGTSFAVGVFTNLSPDHLDYHGTLDEYFDAKATLFRSGLARAAVINADDERGRALADELAATDLPVVAYSQAMLEDVEVTMTGTTFRWRGHRVELALPGLFNMENALAAAEAVRLLGVADDAIAAGLSAAQQVPGRFEVVVEGLDDIATVIVDYSHTPAGIEQVLRSVREIDPAATVCVVFGAGGDRDREKRPLMGAAAAAGADHVIVTSDNPRSEDPVSIAAEIVAGAGASESLDVELDRRSAIAMALRTHRQGDVVVVAGKGHERTQTIGDRVIDFDDRTVVRELVGGGRP